MGYHDELNALQESSEYVTFVDALVLVRLYRQRQSVDEPFLSALAQWVDAPQLTNGAKEVLVALLRAEGRRVGREKARSARALGMSDHGRRIRVDLGSPVSFELERRDQLGLEWKLLNSQNAVSHSTLVSAERAGLVTFTLEFTGPGNYQILLREQAVERWERPSARSRHHEPRELCVELIVSQPVE